MRDKQDAYGLIRTPPRQHPKHPFFMVFCWYSEESLNLFDDEVAAEKAARKWAEERPSASFFVMEAKSILFAKGVEITKLNPKG
jgi:hypothetical protein